MATQPCRLLVIAYTAAFIGNRVFTMIAGSTMSQTDPDRPRPRTQLRLRSERTADPDTIRFVIAALGWSRTAGGRQAPDGCPGKLAQLLEQGARPHRGPW